MKIAFKIGPDSIVPFISSMNAPKGDALPKIGETSLSFQRVSNSSTHYTFVLRFGGRGIKERYCCFSDWWVFCYN